MASSNFEERRSLHLLSAAVFGIPSVLFVVLLIWHMNYGRSTLTWPSTNNVTYVTSFYTGEDSPPRFVYEYKVDGKKYKAGKAGDQWATPRKGDRSASPVFYSPSKPANYTWKPGVKSATVVTFSCISALLFIPAVIFLVMATSPQLEKQVIRILPFPVGY